MKHILMAIIASWWAFAACATEYFVEKGGDDDNPGSRMQPFKTIQRAAGVMLPGDVCTVSRGLYHETVRPARSGRPDSPIRFQAAPGESVTISGADELSGLSPATGGVYRANMRGVIQVLVDDTPALPDLALTASKGDAAKPAWFYDEPDGTLYVRFPGNGTPDSGRVEVQTRAWGFDAGALANVEMKGFNLKACGANLEDARFCRLDDCHLWWAEGSTGKAHTNDSPAAVLIGGSENEVLNSSLIGCKGVGVALLPDGVNNRVVNCLVRGQGTPGRGGIGILAQGTAPVIRNVSILNHDGGALVCRNVMNARIENNDFHHAGDGATNTCMVLLTGDGKGTILAYNWIHDNTAVGGDGIRMQGVVENYIIRQNVVWSQPGTALKLSGVSRYNFLFNNTCAVNGCGVDVDVPGVGLDLRETRVINNILAGPVWPSTGGAPPPTMVWTHNFTGGTPGFVDETNCNFRLSAGSPCVDAGQEEPEFTDEFTGKLPDIGAYELDKDYPAPGCHVMDNANKVITPVVKIVVESGTDGAEIRYTLDGRAPDGSSPLYTGAVPVV